MPRGPRGEKRPADVIGNAVKVMRIATREEGEELDITAAKKDAAAVALGKRGGLVGGLRRAAVLSSDRKREIAKQGARARWKRDK